jgi:hypothetical protein
VLPLRRCLCHHSPSQPHRVRRFKAVGLCSLTRARGLRGARSRKGKRPAIVSESRVPSIRLRESSASAIALRSRAAFAVGTRSRISHAPFLLALRTQNRRLIRLGRPQHPCSLSNDLCSIMCSVHFVAFVFALLSEHSEQHNSESLGEKVSDSPRQHAEIKSKFEQTISKRPGMRSITPARCHVVGAFVAALVENDFQNADCRLPNGKTSGGSLAKVMLVSISFPSVWP